MAYKLSPRLSSIVKCIAGDKLADIACDHAYISIGAVLSGCAACAVACDISENSLQKARANIENAGLSEKIATRLSDGLLALGPGEADCVVIAGIGGRLMSGILLNDISKTRAFGLYILEPQSEVFLVRRALHTAGFRIAHEDIIKENTFYYPVIEARQGRDEQYSDTEYLYGRIPLINKHPLLRESLENELAKALRVKDRIPKGCSASGIEGKIAMIKEALTCL